MSGPISSSSPSPVRSEPATRSGKQQSPSGRKPGSSSPPSSNRSSPPSNEGSFGANSDVSPSKIAGRSDECSTRSWAIRALFPSAAVTRHRSSRTRAGAFVFAAYTDMYAAAKAGMLAHVRSCAAELASVGIRVNGIALGTVDTDISIFATYPTNRPCFSKYPPRHSS